MKISGRGSKKYQCTWPHQELAFPQPDLANRPTPCDVWKLSFRNSTTMSRSGVYMLKSPFCLAALPEARLAPNVNPQSCLRRDAQDTGS